VIRETFQLLDHRVVLEADSAEVAARMAYLVQDAVQDAEVTTTVVYRVETESGRSRIYEDGALVDEVLGAGLALEAVHIRLHASVFDAFAARGWVRLHAGLASLAGRRVLFVGAKASGKTTLLARLALDGALVEGDEMVVIDSGLVAAFPRRLRIKVGTVDLLPAIAPLIADAPSVNDEWDTPVFAWAPRVGGRPWRTSFGPVHDVVCIEPNHGGRSRLVAIPGHVAAERVMREVFADSRDRSWLAPVCATLAAATSHELRLGDLDGAVEQLRTCLVAAPAGS
jgi:hypothetical protein